MDVSVVSSGLLASLQHLERERQRPVTLAELAERVGLADRSDRHLAAFLQKELSAGRVVYRGGRFGLTTAGRRALGRESPDAA